MSILLRSFFSELNSLSAPRNTIPSTESISKSVQEFPIFFYQSLPIQRQIVRHLYFHDQSPKPRTKGGRSSKILFGSSLGRNSLRFPLWQHESEPIALWFPPSIYNSSNNRDLFIESIERNAPYAKCTFHFATYYYDSYFPIITFYYITNALLRVTKLSISM